MSGTQPTTKLTPEDIKALVASLGDITATLAAADPADKAKIYAEMGIDITYQQDGHVVVESRPRVVDSGVGEEDGNPSGSFNLHGPVKPTRSLATARLPKR